MKKKFNYSSGVLLIDFSPTLDWASVGMWHNNNTDPRNVNLLHLHPHPRFADVYARSLQPEPRLAARFIRSVNPQDHVHDMGEP